MSSAFAYPPLMDRPRAGLQQDRSGRRWHHAAWLPLVNGGGRRPLFGTGLAVAGLALAVAGCGGGSPEAGVASVRTTTTSTASTASSASAGGASGSSATGGSAPGGELVEYARCMRAHGVSSFPEPGSLAAPGAIRAFKGEVVQSVGSLGSSPVFQAAQRACARSRRPAHIGARGQCRGNAEASRRVPVHAAPTGSRISRTRTPLPAP